MWQLWSQQWAASPWKVGVLQVLYVHVSTPLRLTSAGKCGGSVWDPCPRPPCCPLLCRGLLGVWACLIWSGFLVCGSCVEVGGAAVWELTAWCGHYSAVCESPECVCVFVCVPADSFSHSAVKDHTVCRQQMARVCDLITMCTVEWERSFWLVILASWLVISV